MRVSVLIGSRNRPEVLLQSLESVLGQDYPHLEVVVLDHASEGVDLCRFLAERFRDPRLRCLRSEVQLGVAGGRNRLVRESTGEVLCFIDDDACFEGPHVVARMVRVFSSNERIGVVACKVVDHRTEGTDLLVPFPRFWRRRNPGLAEQGQYVSYYLGTCHAIRREVLELCGTYAEGLVFGEEELDLSYRVIASGYRIYYDPLAVVHHYPQASVVGRSGELYHRVKNRLYLAYRYLPVRYIPFYLAFWLGYYLWQSIRGRELPAYFAGLRDGILGLRHYPRVPIDPQTQAYLRKHYGRLWF